MGFLSKLFGKGDAKADDDAPVAPTAVNLEVRRAQLAELSAALTALRVAMLEPGNPLDNPGWKGRAEDFGAARVDIDRLSGRTFGRDDMYEELCGVRPLYRGTAPEGYAHLAAHNQRVIDALDALYAPVAGE
ncbi:MAG TPA: hypothetical protein PKE40_01845 [Arachnia sp.]|nr:hypothetical protein [Arachnia sp.]HMT85071.1 hypothetical protein [Arachnia sp.]